MMTIDCIDETRSHSILVVEDDANALKLLRACLERNGYEVTSAGTLAEARRRLKSSSDWGLVILDRELVAYGGVDHERCFFNVADQYRIHVTL